MSKTSSPQAQNPLILRSHRLMEAFAKSNDERDFYLDKMEGFIIYIDLSKPLDEVSTLKKELESSPDRYCPVPKLTFYETKKIMEGFVNEKVYDIDTKEKLLDIIQSHSARENFLEFIQDNHAESDKWQQYYQERSRIRITEWLRSYNFHFVFEEDLDLSKALLDKLKKNLFESKVGKDVTAARKMLVSKAKVYYSNEALNPRPKRGRPPKQAAKLETETHLSTDIYTTVPKAVRPFLFVPEISSLSSVTFSSKFANQRDLSWKTKAHTDINEKLQVLNKKLASLQTLSNRWSQLEKNVPSTLLKPATAKKTTEAPQEPVAELGTELFTQKKEEEKKAPSPKKKPLTSLRPLPKKKAAVAKATPPKKRKLTETKPKKEAAPKKKRIIPRKIIGNAKKKS